MQAIGSHLLHCLAIASHQWLKMVLKIFMPQALNGMHEKLKCASRKALAACL